MKKLEYMLLNSSFSLVFLDVVSLFINVPIDLTLVNLKTRWNYIGPNTIPEEEFISAVSFILSSTFFSFNGRYYKQTYGTPMGFSISPIIADIVLQDLETVLNSLDFLLPFFL